MPRMMSVKASERRVSEGIAGGGLVLICLRRVGMAVDMVDDQAVNGEEGSAQGQISLRSKAVLYVLRGIRVYFQGVISWVCLYITAIIYHTAMFCK